LANKLDKYLGLLYEAINYYRGVGIDLREREGVRGIGAAVATSATTLTAMEVILSLLEAITALLNSLPGKKEEDVIDNSAGSGSGAGAGVDKAGLSPILLVGLLGAVAFMAIKDRPKS
jgi:hypothetical protein